MSETRIDSGTPEYYNGWKDIKTKGSGEGIYEFVTHTYEGSGGYVNGDYIDRFEKETDTSRRKRLVYLKNYVKGIVDSLLVPVFSEEAIRSTDNDMFVSFLTNVDNKGHSMQEFSKTVVKYARIHGVCFTVMDNFSEDEIPDTQQEAINSRKYPYLYYRTADEVIAYTTNEFNTLQTITFCDGDYVKSDGSETDVYRVWTPEYSVRFIVDNNKPKEIEERNYHGLGFLPVIATYTDIESDILPHPPVYDLCRMNYTVYNMDSEQRNLERLCAFPMLTLQTKEHDVNMNIGSDSVITYGGEYDGSVTAPSWINPSPEILKIMNDLSNEVVQKLVESANVLGASAINTGNQAKSGVALSYQFLGQNFALKHTARMAERFEEMVSLMFGLYIGESIEYTVHYNDNYQPSQDDLTKKMAIIQTLLDMNMSESVTAELQKELIKDVAGYYKFAMSGDELAQSIATTDLI